jgi:hypothetical protein
MKKLILVIGISLFHFNITYSQTDTSNSISDQIKSDRDKQLNNLNDKLKVNGQEILELTAKIGALQANRLDREKFIDVQNLQLKLGERLIILENAPKNKIKLNGQLAFIELLSIQRDLKPALLFLNSKNFLEELGNIGNLKKYQSFNNWNDSYKLWYAKQTKNDQMLELINNSILLISNASNKVPLYGSIVQTASSGITEIISNLGGKHKDLVNQTPKMLRLLNTTSQFESQKVFIDHEWERINKELMLLEKENNELLNEQLTYYNISYNDYTTRYINETLDNNRDNFKNECRNVIIAKLSSLESNQDTKNKWLGQVETFMYKVQSLRLRFGELANRMQSNLDQYENLIVIFSVDTNFPTEFTSNIKGLGKTLSSVKKTFSETFKPEKYIEDSAIMYIERQ